ncbi:MAG: PQQ-dependent sugar dehydrogenase [Bacteroidota bacterium]
MQSSNRFFIPSGMTLGLLLFCLFFSACTEDTATQREEVRFLLFGSTSNQQFQEVFQLASTAAARVDTSSNTDVLRDPFLAQYSTVVFLETAVDQFPPQAQAAVERYTQANGGLVFIKPAAPAPFRWPFYQQIYEQEASQFDMDGGRIVKGNEMPQADQIKFVIGNNAYDYSLATTPFAPDFDRFTKVPLDTEMNEPMELAVLPNGSVLYIERRGKMKLYDNVKKATRLIHEFNVCTAGNYEDGLLGLALHPEYGRKNQWLYLYYSPPCDTLSQFLSRFNFYDDSLDVASETVVLKVDVQRETCCHSGGSIAFGPQGLLYLSTGDNTSSKESDGFSPLDERPGRGPFDAQKSSGNTNDLRGKILRIRLTDEGGYEIPEGNLFPPDGSKGRPEIYVMGARNPFRISVDAKNGYLYWGDVGPDGGSAGKYGPESFDEWNQAKEAGNYGWPFFVGDNFGYPDRDFENGTIGAMPDPKRPVNTSPYNTGDSILPPAQPAMIWYPYGASEEFPLLGAGGRSAMAGPIYYQDIAYPGSKIKLPEYYNGKLFIYEWVRNWINVCTFDEEGQLVKIEPFMDDDKHFAGPLDMEIGPDGAIYLLEYGNAYFLDNPEAMISRIEYAAGNRKPIAQLACQNTNGVAPFKTHFSAAKSFDYDAQDSLRFEWYFTDNKNPQASGPEVDFTFKEKGVYPVILEVTDKHGSQSTAEVIIQVGNQPPVVDIAYQGNQSFYDEKSPFYYEVKVQDQEDESNGGIDLNSTHMAVSYLSDVDYFHQLVKGKSSLPAGDIQFMEGRQLIENSDCRTCHQNEEKTIGPSYVMVAQKYQDRYDAVEYLAGKIIKGGNGVWGKSMMSAHPDISRKQAAQMAQYVLSLGTNEQLPAQGRLQFEEHPDDHRGGGYALVATYKDKGANSIGPLESRSVKLLRSPIVEAEHCDERSDVYQRRFGKGLVQTCLEVQKDGSYIVFEDIDLTNVKSIGLVAKGSAGGKADLRLGSVDGAVIGSFQLSRKDKDWKTYNTNIRQTSGRKNIYLVFSTNAKDKIASIDLLHFKLSRQNNLLGLK